MSISKFDNIETQGFTDVPQYDGVTWKDGNSETADINEIPAINAVNLNKSENALRALFGVSGAANIGYLQGVINNQKEINAELHSQDNNLNDLMIQHKNHRVMSDGTETSNPHGITKNTIGLGNVDNYSFDTIHTRLTADSISSANTEFVSSGLAYASFVDNLKNINAHQTIRVNSTSGTPVYEAVNIDLTLNDSGSHKIINEDSNTIKSIEYDVDDGKLIIQYQPINIGVDQVQGLEGRLTNTSTVLTDHGSKLTTHETTLATHGETLTTHENTLATHEERLNGIEEITGASENFVKYYDTLELNCGTATSLIN